VRVEILAPRSVATRSSFDLAPFDDGAVLIWGSATPSRVSAVAVGPLGEGRGQDYPLSDRLAIEVTAIAEGSRIGAAWVAQESGREVTLIAEAAFAPGGVDSFGPSFSLGPTEPVSPGRGRLAMASTDDGALLVSHRIPEGPCTGDPTGCARLARDRIDVPGSARGDDPLEVPTACEPFVAGSVRSHGTWYSAICHAEDGVPNTTIYAIRPSISLAAATEVLPGCSPRSIVPTETGAALIGMCPEGISVAWQDDVGRGLGSIRGASFRTECAAGRPTLIAELAGNSLRIPLTAPVGRLEGMLPTAMGDEHARAVWTGSALLVARHRAVGEGGEVALARFECVGESLMRTDL
jgi:hypothetical protein